MRGTRAFWARWAVLLLAIGLMPMGLPGCGDDAPGGGQQGEACSEAEPCASGLICVMGVCEAEGDVFDMADSDVADDADVQADGDAGDTDGDGSMDTETDGGDAGCDGVVCGESCCATGELCQDGACVGGCDSDRVGCDGICCGAGELCDNGSCAGDCGNRNACEGVCCGFAESCNGDGVCERDCSSNQVKCGTGGAARCCPGTAVCNDDNTCGTCPDARLCGATCCPEGEECAGGICQPVCAGTRCGTMSELCCMNQEICIFDACTVPGAACVNSIQCPSDQYCEPSLQQCIPRILNDGLCESVPELGVFTPSPERDFQSLDVSGTEYGNSITTPVVADVDNDGLPEVAAVFYETGGLSSAVLVILNGEDMSLSANSAADIQPNSAGIAVGQLDSSTPELEIVAIRQGGGLIAFRHDGSMWWELSSGDIGDSTNHSAPAIADVNGDGSPEIVVGFSVVLADGSGTLVDQGRAGGNFNGTGSITAAVDLDGVVNPMSGQREMEIVAGNRALKLDGTFLWDVSGSVGDGYVAVADFDGDAAPEVVNVTDGEVYVLDGLTGATEFGPVAIPNPTGCGNNRGGPPTVADFDGDGQVEFASAGCGAYTVYDLDCQMNPDPMRCASMRTDGILWSSQVQDLSSSVTGSSVFDFDGDGRAEVVYNDECFLRVFDGQDGTVLFEVANSTRTGSENPIIVDVDGDFKAEIVVVSNNDEIVRDDCSANPGYPAGGTHGIFVYGDAMDNWVPTRQLWNQHTFHITNVNDDGTIPAQEDLHYASADSNSFRLNRQGEGLFDAPDLIVDNIVADNTSCPSSLQLTAVIRNDGSLGVPAGVWVHFEVIDMNGMVYDAGRVQTMQPLLPGTQTTVSLNWTPPPGLSGELTIRVTVDSDPMSMSEFRECREMNNEDTLGMVECNDIN